MSIWYYATPQTGYNSWVDYPYYTNYQNKQFIKEAIEEALREHGVIKDEPNATPLEELAGEYADEIIMGYIEAPDNSVDDDINFIQAFLVAFAEELKEKGIL